MRTAIGELRALGEEGRAAELEVAISTARDAARRTVTDRSDLFDAGTVRIGRHQIGIHAEPFELRLQVDQRDDTTQVAVRLSGTDLRIDASDGPRVRC